MRTASNTPAASENVAEEMDISTFSGLEVGNTPTSVVEMETRDILPDVRDGEKNTTSVEPNETSKKVRCRLCNSYFDNRKELIHHRLMVHLSGKGDYPWEENDAPWIKDGNVDHELKEFYNLYNPLIREYTEQKTLNAVYNYPLSPSFTLDDIMVFANKIYNLQQKAFRLNLVFGYILFNQELNEYRYFKPYQNSEIFDFPLYISKRKDLQNFERKLQEIDICSYVLKDRPNTKWRVVLVTNVTFFVYFLKHILGAPTCLPEYITMKKNAIISLHKNPKDSKLYKDNLCLFRCLEYHKLNSFRDAFETRVKKCFETWCEFMFEKEIYDVRYINVTSFQGVALEHIPLVEECFKVNIDIFELDQEANTHIVYKSPSIYDDQMYLNMYENHLSYITNMKRYANKYVCSLCQKHFTTCKKLHRHEKGCSNKTLHIFPGGFNEIKNTIFETLREIDIIIQEDDEYFPWFIVFDFEAILEKSSACKLTSKLELERIHKPISVSICSNVPDFEMPYFILNEDVETLLREMITYMDSISLKVFQLAQEKWSIVFEKLHRLLEFWKPIGKNQSRNNDVNETSERYALECQDFEPPSKRFLKKIQKKNVYEDFQKRLAEGDWKIDYNDHSTDSDGTESETESLNEYDLESEDIVNENNRIRNMMYNYVQKLLTNFTNYCMQTPVLGFNSSKYDINLVKNKLTKVLGMHEKKKSYAIKRNNSYTCIATSRFRFLDMSQFIAPGTSYAKFLKAYGVEEEKGFFPYEWFDSIEKLNYPKLPEIGDAWFSTLKQKSILDDGKHSIEENYLFLEEIWNRFSMKSFKDFLQWYNNLDVKPFVQGIINYCKLYWEKKIDIFKIAVSIPGIARLNLFNTSQKCGAIFPLFDFSTKDIYRSIQDNIVGGPSIIFTRYHKSGETFIRNNIDKPCGRIVGYDANALYLYCIGQPMPVGYFVIRRESNKFKAEKKTKYYNMYIWMNWLIETHGYKILHKLNNNREKRIGPFPVDGYDPFTKTVYQYNGCYYHGHCCHLNRSMNSNERLKRFNKTKDCEKYLVDSGYKVQSIWECEFLQLLSKNKSLQHLLNKSTPNFYKKCKGGATMNQILKSVKKDELFGIIECDIEVPSKWNDNDKPNTSLSPEDYFSEMAPLFCTTEVAFSEIGEHMQTHAKEIGLSENPRTLLIGGNRANKIMLATPLLKWYLEKGLVVTRIYTVIESAFMKCFSEFTKNISDARRKGDRDPTLSVISDTVKVEGNSAYGSLLLNKDKFTNISFVEGVDNASKKVNEPLFMKLTELDNTNNFFEIEMAKKKIIHNMPIQLGFFVLQYAKLRMLEFYYDFLDQFVDRTDFEFMEMDTDSAYFAISESSLSDVIKPHLKDKYFRTINENCTDNHNVDSVVWFPRKCCMKHATYDKRTPGLFKLEFDGDSMIGLCSKTYAIVKSDEGKEEVKFSSKGISKRSIQNPMETYKKVLDTRNGEGLNRGFLLKDNKIFSYNQTRNGITYFYCKRKVLEDGVHTSTLNITMTPRKKQKLEKD